MARTAKAKSTVSIHVRLAEDQAAALDAWRNRQPKALTRAGALRQFAFKTIPVPIRTSGQWASGVLNEHLAPGINEFTEADIPELSLAHPEALYWISNHMLNSVFGPSFTGPTRLFVLNLIHRAQAAFIYYSQGRDLTLSFVAGSSPGQPLSRTYFTALRSWEAVFLNIQIGMDLLRKLQGMELFKKGDGSQEQRAYSIANAIKHYGDTILAWDGQDPLTVPMWMANDGFVSKSGQLTFGELAEIVGDFAMLADEFENPATYAQKRRDRQAASSAK